MKNVMVILANYASTVEDYGLLGPQIAATIIQDNTDYECVVVAVGHEFDKESIKRNIMQLARGDRLIVGFSNLGGRHEMWELAKELKTEGAITILGGPQADVDYLGEVACESYPHRFLGVSDSFCLALQGPAEQLIPFLSSQNKCELDKIQGALFVKDGKRRINKQDRWGGDFIRKVNWTNLYRLSSSGPEPIFVSSAQVVQQIGCPYAARTTSVSIDYPTTLKGVSFTKRGRIALDLRGCSFCDVARDKGFGGTLPLDGVLAQIINLPEDGDGRKIPFELINEAPFTTLPQLLSAIKEHDVKISQLNLLSRADWLVNDREKIQAALKLARNMNIRVLLSAVGFESFSESILRNLNKGYPVDINLSAIQLMRQLKEQFPENWFYTTADGASHGFIHPTAWDSTETEREINTIISVYGLNRDILPKQSTPLIIHHACGLGDWVRELEKREGITLKRTASIIEWW
jgi:hypothetical protein